MDARWSSLGLLRVAADAPSLESGSVAAGIELRPAVSEQLFQPEDVVVAGRKRLRGVASSEANSDCASRRVFTGGAGDQGMEEATLSRDGASAGPVQEVLLAPVNDAGAG